MGDYLSLTFSDDLASSITTGTGNVITITSAANHFNPAAVNDGSNLQLAWGINTGETSQPFGAFQSNVVGIPEPASSGLLLLGGLALALRRRRA